MDLGSMNVLDVGGRIQPYRPLLDGRICKYVAIDLRRTPLVDIIARAQQIPLASGQFDLLICTQVLEYIPDPIAVITEFHRVLKPGGFIFLSAPALAARDNTEEYWRFLPAGFRNLLRDFREIKIAPEGGSVVGFFRTINTSLDVFVKYSSLRMCYRWTICPILNLLGEILDRVAASSNDQFTVNYSVWARK